MWEDWWCDHFPSAVDDTAAYTCYLSAAPCAVNALLFLFLICRLLFTLPSHARPARMAYIAALAAASAALVSVLIWRWRGGDQLQHQLGWPGELSPSLPAD